MIFPKIFALKVKSTGKMFGIKKTEPFNLYANSNTNDYWETFKVLYFPEINSSGNHTMLVCLKSLGNGKYLSARNHTNSKLYVEADRNSCGETEKFELHIGQKNTISFKSRLNNKFLGSSLNREKINEPLAFEHNQFIGLEVEKFFDKSHFPQVKF